jgi:transposase
MKEPIFVRSLTQSEGATLRASLRSNDAFTLRRSQILLASAEGKTPRQIAGPLCCTDQTVRNVIRAFEREGVECLKQKSSAPKTRRPALDEAKREQLRALLHPSPRQYGKARSLWTLNLVAEVCFEQGLTRALVSDETIRDALRRMGVRWKRARDWITSPDTGYARKKSARPVDPTGRGQPRVGVGLCR